MLKTGLEAICLSLDLSTSTSTSTSRYSTVQMDRQKCNQPITLSAITTVICELLPGKAAR